MVDVPVTEEEAWLMIRMSIALGEEGIGPRGDEASDGDVIERAYRMVRDRVPEHYREDFE